MDALVQYCREIRNASIATDWTLVFTTSGIQSESFLVPSTDPLSEAVFPGSHRISNLLAKH